MDRCEIEGIAEDWTAIGTISTYSLGALGPAGVLNKLRHTIRIG